MTKSAKQKRVKVETSALLKAYKRMLFIRIVEQELVKVYTEKKLFSMVHFYIGQEAVAVGVCDTLRRSDKVMGNHRSHGHYLAKGGNLRAMVCELLGRANGLARGKGGSMHMIDKSVNFAGSTPLLGSVAPLATGVAFEQKYNRRDAVTVAFYGDGASEEGVVYEAYNIAALYKLPLLFVIENNLFSVNSYIKNRRASQYDVKSLVESFGLRFARADGNDYHDVHAKAQILVNDIRANKGPAVLECMTYRHLAHSTPLSDENYRTEDTLEKRVEKDSLRKLHDELIGMGVSQRKLATLEKTLLASVIKEIEYAQKSPFPRKDELYTEMYAS